MTKRAPRSDVGDENLEVSGPKRSAVGLKAVLNSLAMSNNQMGPRRTFLTLSQVNQKGGFDCPGCAWPDPDPEQLKLF